jgi:general stress protein 26
MMWNARANGLVDAVTLGFENTKQVTDSIDHLTSVLRTWCQSGFDLFWLRLALRGRFICTTKGEPMQRRNLVDLLFITPFALVLAFTQALGSGGQIPSANSTEGILQASIEIMKSARFCALITLDKTGHPQARAMDPFPPDPDLTVWLATRVDTRKVAQLEGDSRATLYYFDPSDPGYVTLIGEARIVDNPDQKQKRWKEGWQDYYDDGNRGSDYLLIEFKPSRVEVVSAKHGIAVDPKAWKPEVLEFREED